MMDSEIGGLLAMLFAVVALYAKYVGPYQTQLSEWVIEARQVESRYKGLVNLAVGVVLAVAISGVAAWYLGNLFILPVGVLAGALASVEAAKVHDDQEPEQRKAFLVRPGQR
jgi:hypothetical protein